MKRALVIATLCLAAPALAAPWEKSGIDWTKPPAAGPEPSFKPPRGERFQLANGITVVVVTDRTLPLVSAELVIIGAGSASDPAGKSGLASFTADLVDEGAGELDALALVGASELLGAIIQTDAGHDSAEVSVAALRRTLEPTLALVAKIVSAPRFDAKEVSRVHEDTMTELELRRDHGGQVATMVVGMAVLGRQSPYGRPTEGLPAEMAKVGRDDAMGFYAARWRPEKTTLVVAGDVSAAELKPMLEKTLGAWKPAAAKSVGEPPPRGKREAARVILVDRPGAEQSDLRFGIAAPKYGGPDTAAIEVTRTLLGGMFTSRLNRRLREQLGYTYGVRASWPARREPAAFVIGGGFFTPKTADSIREVLSIGNAMAKKPVPADELRRGVQNQLRGFSDNFATNGARAASLALLAELGLPEDFWDQFLAALPKVSAKQVQGIAKNLLAGNKLQLIVVGDLKTVLPEIRKLKLGKELRLDRDGNPI